VDGEPTVDGDDRYAPQFPSTPSPRAVSENELDREIGKSESDAPRGKDNYTEAIYHALMGSCYAVAALTGHEHWQLDHSEASSLAEQLDRCAIVYGKRNRTVRAIARYLPLISLATTAGGIFGQRIKLSYAIAQGRITVVRKEDEPPIPAPGHTAASGDTLAAQPVPASSGPPSRNGSALRELVARPLG
jgi:hypothetical protein